MQVNEMGECYRFDKMIFNDISKEYEAMKKYRVKHNIRYQKLKFFDLINGREDNFSWRIQMQIKPNGHFATKGTFKIQNLLDAKKKIQKERKENPQKYREIDKKRMNAPKRKEMMKRIRNERYRNLGFKPLNKPIEGIECEAHHINKEDIIYIPKIIHQKIHHNLKTSKNMDVINSIAFSFL